MVRVRHACETKSIVAMNELLNDAEKGRIRRTPFAHTLDIKQTILISTVLMKQLVSRWVEASGGFRVGYMIVPFTPLDVCFALGLRIIGKQLPVDNDGISSITSLFDGDAISTENIVKKLHTLHGKDVVDDVCRLYIVLACKEFYFPKKYARMTNSGVLTVLNELDYLDNYSWGTAVYESLVAGLNRATSCLRDGKNVAEIHLTGCAAVLQIWAIEHICLRPKKEINIRYPRILSWQQLEASSIKKAFLHNMIVDEICVMDGDEDEGVLMEAIQEARVGFPNWAEANLEKGDIERQMKLMEEENADLKQRLVLLEHEVAAMKDIILYPTSNQIQSAVKMKNEGNKSSVVVEDNMLQTKLYKFCINGRLCQQRPGEHLVSMFGQYLTRNDVLCMKPRGWVNNMVFYVASKVLMHDQCKKGQSIDRYIFNPDFVLDVAQKELEDFQNGRPKTWSRRNILKLVHHENEIETMKHSNLIFAPALFDAHWFCYVLNQKEKKMYILDSMRCKSTGERAMLDKAMKFRFENLLAVLNRGKGQLDVGVDMEPVDLPQQHNNNDCGIYVLKYLEIWDGVKKWSDNTMPDYSAGDINCIRREIVCGWVLHSENVCVNGILAAAKLC